MDFAAVVPFMRIRHLNTKSSEVSLQIRKAIGGFRVAKQKTAFG
jgi:hypothetical protein